MPDLPLPDLPVAETFPELRRALADAGTAVLVAPPGAGKTTLAPLALLDEEWLDGRRIVVLEPRPRAEETDAFRRVVKAAFQSRRKTLRNAWKGLYADKEQLEAAE